jgi:hypothetical protein
MGFRSAEDLNFFYELFDLTGEDMTSLNTNSFSRERTIGLTNYFWQFRRRAKKKTKSHLLSVHTHYLHIQDIGGDSAILLDEIAQTIYREANLILVILDPTILTKENHEETVSKTGPLNEDEFDLSLLFDQPRQETSSSAPKNIRSDAYADYLKHLLDFIVRQGNSRPQIAVCLTKSDAGGHHANVRDALLRAGFGREMQSVLNQYESRLTMRFFSVSSLGRDANTTREKDHVQAFRHVDPPSWHPKGVEKPLFWFLETIERQKLMRASGLKGLLFRNENLRNYMPYENN